MKLFTTQTVAVACVLGLVILGAIVALLVPGTDACLTQYAGASCH